MPQFLATLRCIICNLLSASSASFLGPAEFTYKYTTIAENSYTPDNVSVLSHTGSDLLLPFMYLRYDAMSEEQLATPRSGRTAMADRQWLHRLPRHSKPYEHYFLWDTDEGKWKGVQSGVYLSRQQPELNKFNWPTRAPIIKIPEWAVDVTYNATPPCMPTHWTYNAG